jgi:phosphoribosylaminoimidazolecarboxamide formyltransferase/IMP cyclohydrolase
LKRLLKKKNLRVMTWDPAVFPEATRGRVRAWGLLQLSQGEDEGYPELADWNVVAGNPPTADLRRDLELAWKVCKHGKSNAIVLARGGATLGCGFGQMSRVDSVKLAVRKAGDQGLDLDQCVAASDGFFPFPDGVEELARAGVRAVVAPGGSIRDEEVAAAARELGITLILTSRRHFNH